MPLSVCTAEPGSRGKIGVTIPLTGALANVGQYLRNMVILADQREDKADKVEFIFEDDAFKPSSAAGNVRKFITWDKVSGALLFGSGTSLAAAPVLEEAGVPAIAIAMVDEVVKGRKYIFRHYLTVETQNSLISNEVQRRGYPSVGIAMTQQDAMTKYRELFLGAHKARVTLDEQMLPGQLDISAIAAKIKKADPSAVYLIAMPPELGLLPRRLRELGYKGDFFGPSQLKNHTAVASSKGALEGAWFATIDDRNAGKVYEEYAARFGDPHPLPEGLNAYEAATLFIRGAESGNIQNFLAHPTGEGVLGKFELTEPNTFVVPGKICRIKGGGFVDR